MLGYSQSAEKVPVAFEEFRRNREVLPAMLLISHVGDHHCDGLRRQDPVQEGGLIPKNHYRESLKGHYG